MYVICSGTLQYWNSILILNESIILFLVHHDFTFMISLTRDLVINISELSFI